MSPFERALDEESKWLCVIPEQRMPHDPRAGHRVYIGPCFPPLDALRYLSPTDSERLPDSPAKD